MKKTYKLISIAIVAVMVMVALSTTLLASPFTPDQLKPSSTAADTQIQSVGGKVFGAIRTVGIVLSVVMLAILGVKYMMGSSEEKAEYKKTMIPYLVGAVLIFGASTIAGMVYNMTSM